ncbi:MAG: hypothetical protein Q7U40_07880 [Desulfatirhabdiaceae bacterium]|nr:hypothetical protein [Desulfatirhabdiaceae bacterium]
MGEHHLPRVGVHGKSVVWEVTSTPDEPTIAPLIVTMRAGRQEKMMLTLILKFPSFFRAGSRLVPPDALSYYSVQIKNTVKTNS